MKDFVRDIDFDDDFDVTDVQVLCRVCAVKTKFNAPLLFKLALTVHVI